ncbi:putative Hsc70-interacting protein [Blattamonas nauphoetae]|uniref:Hsc70-interacting protein n=1 Tax=Blattamonas nauphoetae TaxID=2049346 RepID=A0ABQ9YAC9_9EUKA|nr:putative Hsc70-interacting protein [Blattamonas nauphoetae]
MSLPEKQINELKLFLSQVQANPAILDLPDLKFFKDFLLSWGAKIPTPPPPQPKPEPKSEPPPKQAEPEKEETMQKDEDEDEQSSDSEPQLTLENPDLPIVTPSLEDIPIPVPEPKEDVDFEKAGELKQEAQAAKASGDLAKALELITQCLEINPNSTINIGLRGQILLDLGRPQGALSDGEEAVKRNPDSAKGYVVRGRANALLGHFKQAYEDLATAQRIDYNGDLDEEMRPLQKKVQYLQAQEGRERRKADKARRKEAERRRAENARIAAENARRAEEERKKEEARQEQSGAGMGGMGGFHGGMGGMPGGMGGMGGMPGGMGGMPGGMGGMPGGMGGMPGGMPDLGIDMNDPELLAAMSDPAFLEGLKDPTKLMSNPKYAGLLAKIMAGIQKNGGMGGGMPGGMGGMPGGMGGMGGMPGGMGGFPGGMGGMGGMGEEWAEDSMIPVPLSHQLGISEQQIHPQNTLVADCLSQFKNGDEQNKLNVVHQLYSTFTSEQVDHISLRESVISSGLLEEFCSTLSSPCSEKLFGPLSGLVLTIVSFGGVSENRVASTLLPPLLTLVSNPKESISKGTTRAIGLLCSGSLSVEDVDGVLNSGIVEGLCSQMSASFSEGRIGTVIEVLRSLDHLCAGLQSFVQKQESSHQKGKNERETHLQKHQEIDKQSPFSLHNRCLTALSEIERTLRSMIAVLRQQNRKEGKQNQLERSELSNWIGGMLIRHFPLSFVGLGEKKEGVIGIDIGRLRVEMEENEKRHEMERRKERERMEAELRKEKERIEEERKKEREELKQKEEARRKKFERQMAELQAEREANQRFIKEGQERQKKEEKEEEERKRQSQVGAAAIELFPQPNYTLSGNKFTKQSTGGGCLVSFEFGAAVARLSLIVGNISSNYAIGIISSTLAANVQTTPFSNLIRGAGGWELHPRGRYTCLNGKITNKGQACQTGAAGQRVVIEADGREGRRTVRMSQDGQTQPAFFTNIPVPFRFAVYIHYSNDSVTIESVEVVKEAQMVGGTIPVQM